MRPRAAPSLALAGALLLSALPARADRPRIPPIHLVYTRGPGASSCPDASALRDAVSSRLGHDPFDDTAARTLKVSIAGRAGQLSVEMEMHLESGDLLWEDRTMRTYEPCSELVRAVGLAVAVRVDPDPEPEPCPVCPLPEPAKPVPVEPAKSEDLAEVAVRLVPPPSVPTPPEPKPLSFRFGLSGWWGSTTTDRGAFGVAIDGGVRFKWFSAALEGRWDPALGPAPVPPSGTLDYTRLTGALLPCGHFQYFAACFKTEWGRFLFSGTAPIGPSQTYTAVGIRLRLEFPVVPRWFALRVAGDLLATVDPASVTYQKTTIFQVARTNAALGAGVLFTLEKP